ARAEAGLTLAFEDGGDVGAGARLDLAVDVDEGQAETLGQAAADRGLAGAHRADQHEVGGGIHPSNRSSPRTVAVALTDAGAVCCTRDHLRRATGARPWPSPRSSNSMPPRPPAWRTPSAADWPRPPRRSRTSRARGSTRPRWSPRPTARSPSGG